MLASPCLSLIEPRSGRLFAALGFVGVVAVAALVNREALLQPMPQQDEPSFVEAAELVAAGHLPLLAGQVQLPASPRRSGSPGDRSWRHGAPPRPDARHESPRRRRARHLRRRFRPAPAAPALPARSRDRRAAADRSLHLLDRQHDSDRRSARHRRMESRQPQAVGRCGSGRRQPGLQTDRARRRALPLGSLAGRSASVRRAGSSRRSPGFPWRRSAWRPGPESSRRWPGG